MSDPWICSFLSGMNGRAPKLNAELSDRGPWLFPCIRDGRWEPNSNNRGFVAARGWGGVGFVLLAENSNGLVSTDA